MLFLYRQCSGKQANVRYGFCEGGVIPDFYQIHVSLRFRKKEGRDFQILRTLQSFAEIVEILIVISNVK